MQNCEKFQAWQRQNKPKFLSMLSKPFIALYLRLVSFVPSLTSLGKITNSSSCTTCSQCSRYSWCIQETFSFTVPFYQVIECDFAEIENVSAGLPDGAWCSPASRISSPDSPRLQACWTIIARTTCCCRSLYCGVVLPAIGPLSGNCKACIGHDLLLLTSARTAVPAI